MPTEEFCSKHWSGYKTVPRAAAVPVSPEVLCVAVAVKEALLKKLLSAVHYDVNLTSRCALAYDLDKVDLKPIISAALLQK